MTFLSVGLAVAISAAGNRHCTDDQVVCAFKVSHCSIMTVKEKERRRLRIDCGHDDVQDLTVPTAQRQIQHGDLTLVLGCDGVPELTVAGVAEQGSLQGFWGGDLENFFALSGVVDDREFFKRSKATACKHSSDPVGCSSQPLFYFVAEGSVGADDGTYWFESTGDLKP